MNHLKELIRAIPDYPKPGILFYDLTTLLQNPGGFHALVDNLCDHYAGNMVDAVVGIEARGFILLRRWRTASTQASSPFASPRSCHRKQLQLPTSSSTARIRSKSTRMQSSPASAF